MAEWQTRCVQGAVSLRMCGFKSLPRHQIESLPACRQKSPSPGILGSGDRQARCALVAQRIERCPAEAEVVGSNPAKRTITLLLILPNPLFPFLTHHFQPGIGGRLPEQDRGYGCANPLFPFLTHHSRQPVIPIPYSSFPLVIPAKAGIHVPPFQRLPPPASFFGMGPSEAYIGFQKVRVPVNRFKASKIAEAVYINTGASSFLHNYPVEWRSPTYVNYRQIPGRKR